MVAYPPPRVLMGKSYIYVEALKESDVREVRQHGVWSCGALRPCRPLLLPLLTCTDGTTPFMALPHPRRHPLLRLSTASFR